MAEPPDHTTCASTCIVSANDGHDGSRADVPPNVVQSLPASADSPEDVFLNREAFDDVCDAVNDLPARLREPFALRFFDEMPYGEIADLLILSNANVPKRFHPNRSNRRAQSQTPVTIDGRWSRK